MMTEKMHKKDLVRLVAAQTNLSQRKTLEVIDAITTSITDHLSKGEAVSIMGFGKFEVRHRAPRHGRNLQKNVMVPIAAKDVPAFRAGKYLKKAVHK